MWLPTSNVQKYNGMRSNKPEDQFVPPRVHRNTGKWQELLTSCFLPVQRQTYIPHLIPVFI